MNFPHVICTHDIGILLNASIKFSDGFGKSFVSTTVLPLYIYIYTRIKNVYIVYLRSL